MTKGINPLQDVARVVRTDILEMAHRAKSAHTAPSLSCVDMLVSLYFSVMKINAKQADDESRDRLIFSKGHGAMALYSILARRGFFAPELLMEYHCDGSMLWEHPSISGLPGIEFATGSLGHGLAIGAGVAIALKRKKSDARVFVIVGDGECDEGSVYEAAAFIGARGLDNIILVMDNNGMQACGCCDTISGCIDRCGFFESLNWHAIKTDGHSFEALLPALSENAGKPLAVIARTVKGKGVSFMENDLEWHYRPPSKKDLEAALMEINNI